MGLTEVMGAMRLELFAKLGLACAVLGFGGLLVAMGLRRNAAAFERARWIPLQDDEAPTGARGMGGQG